MTAFSYHADELAASYATAEYCVDQSESFLDDAYLDWLGLNDHAAIDDIIKAVHWTNVGIDYMLDKYSGSSPYYRLAKIHRLCWEYTIYEPPEYELTWIKICEAWAANDFEGRKVTIAFIDRMRQLIWNEPFHVAWAARPEQEY